MRVINRLEQVYSLHGAGDMVDSVVSIGGHAYRQDIRQAAYRFLNMHLRNDAQPIQDSERDLVTGDGAAEHPIPPEQLRAFATDADIPADQLNTTIDQHFVPVAGVQLPASGQFDAWRQRLLAELRRVSFGYFPERIPLAREAGQQDAAGERTLETEVGIRVLLRQHGASGATRCASPCTVAGDRCGGR